MYDDYDWGQDDYNAHEEELVFRDECAEREDAEELCDDCSKCPLRDTCVDAVFDEDDNYNGPEPPEDAYIDQMYE